METLIAESCRRTIVDIRGSHFDLTGPDGKIILPRVWEATIQPDWSVAIQFGPTENEVARLQNQGDDVVLECQRDIDTWKRERVEERERWERERLMERERWERESLLERQRWEHERNRERAQWERLQEEARQRWERVQEVLRDNRRERGVRGPAGDGNQADPSAKSESCTSQITKVSPCLLWISGRRPRK